jgi:hypothetical protein
LKIKTNQKDRQMPFDTSRRKLFEQGALALLGNSVFSNTHAAPDIGSHSAHLEALAKKISSALDHQTKQRLITDLSSQISSLTTHPADTLSETLHILHKDNLINGKVHVIHGLHFTETQIALLIHPQLGALQ